MTSDEQEARSRATSSACFILLKLSSGNHALFRNNRELVATGPLWALCERRELQTYIEPRPLAAPKINLLDDVSLDYLIEGLDL